MELAMTMSVAHILDVIALIFSVCSIVPLPVSNYVLLAVAAILLSIAGLIS